jgi:hypothetical protein
MLETIVERNLRSARSQKKGDLSVQKGSLNQLLWPNSICSGQNNPLERSNLFIPQCYTRNIAKLRKVTNPFLDSERYHQLDRRTEMCDGTSHAPTTCPPVSDQLKSDAARRTPLDLSNSSTTLENNYASNPAPRNAKVKKSRNTTRQVAQLDVSFSKARRQAQVGKEMKPVEKVAKTESQPKSSQPKKGLTLPELELKVRLCFRSIKVSKCAFSFLRR